MAGAVERFLEAARERGLEPDVHHWPDGTRTAQEAADAVGWTPDTTFPVDPSSLRDAADAQVARFAER